jgi:hypothetical protein
MIRHMVARAATRVASTRRYQAAMLLALGALAAFGVVTAFGDAGNPIPGEAINGTKGTTGTLVKNADGSWTVYVKGQWNWLSHNSDCNVDRAGAGLAMIWNDPNEPGYKLEANGITALVGVKEKLNGDTFNEIDGQVHPADVGNAALEPKQPGVAGQQFNDPAPTAAETTHPFAAWKGGCGGEPFGGSWNPYGAHPYGSWGYDKNLASGGDSSADGGRGYAHTYKSRKDITKICVNFYDVHGGGKAGEAKFQLVNGSNDIDVLKNGDNSIKTNKFNVNGGSCIFFPVIETEATAKATPIESVTDTAKLSGGQASSTGEVTFKAFKNDNKCESTPAFESKKPVTFDSGGKASVTSAAIAPTPVEPGTYYWTATFSPSKNSNNQEVSTSCGDKGETSEVKKQETKTNTGQKVTIKDVASIEGVLSGGSGGTADFSLWNDKAACEANDNSKSNKLFDSGPVAVSTSGGHTLASTETKVTENGTFYWRVEYSGDAVNEPSVSKCTESASITGNNLPAGVDP